MIRCATYGLGYLNRQIITMLYCLGVPESYFIKMQRKAKEYASVNNIVAKFSSKKSAKTAKSTSTQATTEALESL